MNPTSDFIIGALAIMLVSCIWITNYGYEQHSSAILELQRKVALLEMVTGSDLTNLTLTATGSDRERPDLTLTSTGK